MSTNQNETAAAARGSAAAGRPPVMTRGLLLLLAVAGGVAVGNLYWAQPLLDLIARNLHASTGAAGWLVTATQLGYALGVLLIVPLGDMLNRRRLIPVMLLLSAVALAACAAAPTFAALLGAIAVLGVTTVSGQIIVPLAGDMAGDAERGRVVGTVTSGVLTGILVSRSVSGLVAGAAGWRVIYSAAAVLAVVLAVVLATRIPDMPARPRIRYGALLGSIGHAIAQQRTIRWSLVLGATQFGLFTMFWTALTFYLSAGPYHYSVTKIGLFGLFGLAGALAAQRAGRLHDRGWSLPATGAGWALVLTAFALASLARTSLAILIVSIVLLDVAIQSLNILNATRLFTVAGGARSRVNTAMVVANFIAGAIGSAAAGLLWSAGGWTAVTSTGVIFAAFGLGVWLLGRRGPLVLARAEQASAALSLRSRAGQWPATAARAGPAGQRPRRHAARTLPRPLLARASPACIRRWRLSARVRGPGAPGGTDAGDRRGRHHQDQEAAGRDGVGVPGEAG